MATVFLEPGRQKRIENGHPWIYKTEIAKIEGTFSPGDIVDVADFRGKFLGRGYINPASMITVRLLTRKREEITADFIRERVRKAWKYREQILSDEDKNSCRVIFGEADFLPGIIVDKFGNYLVIQSLTLGISRWQDIIIETLDEILQPKGIYERNDQPVRELEGLEIRKGYLKGNFDPLITIMENKLKIYVDIENGQKTGYFLDQRENRAALRKFAQGARVLDCFCHTGSFSLHAAKYGAKEVIGLDISDEAIIMAKKNAQLNGLNNYCNFYAENAFDALRAFDKDKERFDLIILDPPAFTKSKGTVKSASRGYKEINLRAMRLLREGGFLVTNSCSYHMTEDLFSEILLEAARDVGRPVRIIEMRRQAPDHPILVGYPESYYLKCFILQIL